MTDYDWLLEERRVPTDLVNENRALRAEVARLIKQTNQHREERADRLDAALAAQRVADSGTNEARTGSDELLECLDICRRACESYPEGDDRRWGALLCTNRLEDRLRARSARRRSREAHPQADPPVPSAVWTEDHHRAQTWLATNINRSHAMGDSVESLFNLLQEVREDQRTELAEVYLTEECNMCKPDATCEEHTYDEAGIAEVRQAENEAKGACSNPPCTKSHVDDELREEWERQYLWAVDKLRWALGVVRNDDAEGRFTAMIDDVLKNTVPHHERYPDPAGEESQTPEQSTDEAGSDKILDELTAEAQSLGLYDPTPQDIEEYNKEWSHQHNNEPLDADLCDSYFKRFGDHLNPASPMALWVRDVISDVRRTAFYSYWPDAPSSLHAREWSALVNRKVQRILDGRRSVPTWVVTWEPPINKGTCASVFYDYDAAVKFAQENLIANGWKMNVQILQSVRLDTPELNIEPGTSK